MDNYKAASAFPVPMFVQHTEALLDEIDQMVIEIPSTSRYFLNPFGKDGIYLFPPLGHHLSFCFCRRLKWKT